MVQEGNRIDTNNTLPLISLIRSLLWLKVCYSGKSDAVVLSWKGIRPCWALRGIRGPFFHLHLFLSPRHPGQAPVSFPSVNTESKRERKNH